MFKADLGKTLPIWLLVLGCAALGHGVASAGDGSSVALPTASLPAIAAGSALHLMGSVPDDEAPRCYKTWWQYYEEGELVLRGDHAVVQPLMGAPGYTGTFSQDRALPGVPPNTFSCGFTSLEPPPLREGVHNSLVCIVSTDEGPNPSWTSARDPGGEIDFPPELVLLVDAGQRLGGQINGKAFRSEIINGDLGNISMRKVDFQFYFVAVRAHELTGEGCGGDDPFTEEGVRCNDSALRSHCRSRGCQVVEGEGGQAICATSGGDRVSGLPTVGIVPKQECSQVVRAINAQCR